ncbi:helix-turn-helix transcriptional regulator [Amnibacterium setariae]|uniref:HTH luxR-type domain-containing protein n=1 Tax=Amnibacterium setariae TaxID=2306585 RepID=A0A3A1TTN3_9MICO|nr:LuxR C-terminal-related transcriptional regulator [Amnibacterium setariae]RIX26632.1 hypothetical protein D1781_17110 [Amnibacterium setariae]
MNPGTPGDPAFIGRTALLDAVVTRALGAGSSVLTGPPGTGRSRLLHEVGLRLEHHGIEPIRLRTTASASSVPFGVLLGLLDRPTLLRVGAEDALGRAALVRAAVLALQPRAILVDEASLLDPGSAAFLLELARGGVPLVLATTSGRRVPDAVRALVDDGVAVPVRLDPLDAAAIGALAAGILGGPVDAALAGSLAAASGGSPSAAQEVLRAARRTGAVEHADGLWRLRGELPAPLGERRRAAAAFEAADRPTQDWLCAVALADELADDLADALCADEVADAAERAGWTVHDDRAGTTRLRTAAQVEAVLEGVATRQRRAAVRRLLDAVESLGRDLADRERIAHGAWRLEVGAPVEAAEALELGALTSLAAPDLAERFLRHAIAAGGGLPAEVALAEQLKRTNRLDEAEQLLGSGGTPAEHRSADDVQRVLAYVSGFGARRADQALEVLDAHLRTHGERPELLAVRGGLLWFAMRYREALPLLEPLRRGPVGFSAVFAAMQEVLVRTELGDAAGALEVARTMHAASLRTVGQIPEGPVMLEWVAARVPAVVELDLATADAPAVRGYERSLADGTDALRTPYAHLLGVLRTQQGDLDHAVQLLREAEGLPGIWRDSFLPVITADLGIALVRSGDLDEASETVARAAGLTASTSQQGRVRLAEAELLAASGDRAGSAAIAREVAERARAHGALVEEWDALADAVRYHDRAGAEALLGAEPLPGAARAAQRAHASAVLADEGPVLDAVGRRYWAAGLRWLAVETASAAIARLEEERLPLTPSAERLRQWTAELSGVRLDAARFPTGTPLTAREREVVALAASGLPDRGVAERLGISVRTAQTHLARAFAKLGVHRRADLTAALEGEG